MAEYISRDDVLKKLITVFKLQASTAKAIIESIPAANVRPVVLCRDCEYYQADCGWCGLLDIGMNINGFCSRGEKGETDGEEARRIKKQLALNGLGYPYDLPNVEES